MRDGGKGDSQRPLGVPMKEFDNNWDAIFKKVVNEVVKKEAFKSDVGGVPLLKDKE